MTYNFEDFLPLDFGKTLDLLASWEGRTVRVQTYAAAPGEPMSHTMAVMEGALGAAQMVDNAIDPNVDSVAAFSVGPMPPNGFYVSPGDHVRTQPLPGRDAIRIDFAHSFAIQVELVDQSP